MENQECTPKEVDFLADAQSVGDDADAPSYVLFKVNARFIDRLQKLRMLCKEHGLSELRVVAHPQKWGPGDVEARMRLQSGELVVTEGLAWFTDSPRYGDQIEMRARGIDEIISSYENAKPGEIVVLAGDEVSKNDLLELFREDESDEGGDQQVAAFPTPSA